MDYKEYIERDCIIYSIRKNFDFYYQIPIYPSDREVKNIVNRVKRIVQELPAADVAPVVHGEWFLLDECSNEGVYCSVCTKKVYRTEYANQKLKSNYCPNCGAKMNGGKE